MKTVFICTPTIATGGLFLWDIPAPASRPTPTPEVTKPAPPSLASKRLASARAQLSAELPKDWERRKR